MFAGPHHQLVGRDGEVAAGAALHGKHPGRNQESLRVDTENILEEIKKVLKWTRKTS